jgi:hypothetical protein
VACLPDAGAPNARFSHALRRLQAVLGGIAYASTYLARYTASS